MPHQISSPRAHNHDPPTQQAHHRSRSANVCIPRREMQLPAWETSSFPRVLKPDPMGLSPSALSWVLHNLWTTLWTGLARGGTYRW
jgi:hypothetical protein